MFSLRPKYLWANVPIRRMVLEHEKIMEKYPNRKLDETAGSKMFE